MLNLKADFPALYDKEIAFLDTAASAQKPQAVINAMANVMQDHYANIHRGLYNYSQKTTETFEAVRKKVALFINAISDNEIIFTRNTTEGLNLIAQSYGRNFLQSGDEVIISEMEHHANIVPWQLLQDQIGIVLKVIPITENCELDYVAFEGLLSERTRILSVVHTSNSLGIVNDVDRLIKSTRAFNRDIKIIVDGSQSIVHGDINVQNMNCDFFVFTGHKLYGPSGVGVLWGREELLNSMPPYQGGGDMIDKVSFAETTYKKAPARFEAGTPSIIDVIGLGAAIDYMSSINSEAIIAHEKILLEKTRESLRNVEIYGDVTSKAPIISFNVPNAHHSDVGMILNQCNVAVRTGHHCCMPLMQKLGIDGTVRISYGIYNDMDDVERLLSGLDKVRKLLG